MLRPILMSCTMSSGEIQIDRRRTSSGRGPTSDAQAGQLMPCLSDKRAQRLANALLTP